MPYVANVYRVFIASPGDVERERNIIRSIIADWNSAHSYARGIVLEAIGWDTHSFPELGRRPQESINERVLANADLLIGVFWTRIGTATGGHPSGTVEEIERHILAGKPAMIYFSSAPAHLATVDREQYDALEQFRESLKPRGLYQPYSNPEDFKDHLRNHLNRIVNEAGLFIGPSRPDGEVPIGIAIEDHGLTSDALDLLRGAAHAKGRVLRIPAGGGDRMEIPGLGGLDTSTPRAAARWKSALRELEEGGYLDPIGYKREVFEVTERGYRLCDDLGLHGLTPPSESERSQ